MNAPEVDLGLPPGPNDDIARFDFDEGDLPGRAELDDERDLGGEA